MTKADGSLKSMRLQPPRKRPKTLRQQAYDGILSAILAGELVPGEKLLQRELAEWLGISITPIREALNELAAEGFVVLDPHRGALVRGIELDEAFENIKFLVALLPVEMDLLVERISDDEIEQARAIQNRIEQVEDVRDYIAANRDFHRFLTSCARSPRLERLINPLRDAQIITLSITMRSIPQRIEQANIDHRDLLDALSARDLTAAVAVCLRHVEPNRPALEVFKEQRESAEK